MLLQVSKARKRKLNANTERKSGVETKTGTEAKHVLGRKTSFLTKNFPVVNGKFLVHMLL